VAVILLQMHFMHLSHVRIPAEANISTKFDEKAQNDVSFFQRLESNLWHFCTSPVPFPAQFLDEYQSQKNFYFFYFFNLLGSIISKK
jgi:hypothetical protein